MSRLEQKFKIKLASGRVLGPLDLERIRLLILKNQITGTEIAREHPTGEWRDINQFRAIADLLIAHAAGQLKDGASPSTGKDSSATAIVPGPTQVLSGPTQVLDEPAPEAEPPPGALREIPEVPALEPVPEPKVPVPVEDADKTRVAAVGIKAVVRPTVPKVEESKEDEDRTMIRSPELEQEVQEISLARPPHASSNVASAETVVFEWNRAKGGSSTGKAGPGAPPKRKSSEKFRNIRNIIIIVALLGAAADLYLEPESKRSSAYLAPIKPSVPTFAEKGADPAKSFNIYKEAMALYVLDNVEAYRATAEKLRAAASIDPGNVKALAMLASTYLNLIDSSNKDENYFDVISKLIELSRAKNVDLPETVVADVEFYITINKAEAAQNRIVDYTKTHQNFGDEMFYYLALSFYHRGDPQNAARYLSQIPESRAFSAKIFHLGGLIAEKMNDQSSAISYYQKALKMNPNHAKSRLRIAELGLRTGKLKEVAKDIRLLVSKPRLLAPKELAQAYYLHAQLSQSGGRFDIALGDMERATRLDKGNHDYLLELYSLRAKAGDRAASVRNTARMYFYLSEGEKMLRAGKYQEALDEFLRARQSNDKSPLPPVKIGDMFARRGDIANARLNYKIAAERAPDNIEVWGKYIDVLIQSYEWAEAEKAMDRFRKLPVSQSAIDKAAADMYAKQGRHKEAQLYYRKAMSRENIAPDVYIAYAKSLMASGKLKEAPFFFSLALRFDPLNTEAIIGAAKCIAGTETIDRAITMLQDELQKGSVPRAELVAAVAEFYLQKGELEAARQYIEQAKSINPDYAYPWKLEAEVHMAQESSDRTRLDKALLAYRSYSDRNPSDPSGYLERYRIFVKKTEFEKAEEELERVYGIFPKYPNLHYFKGILYSRMANHNAAIVEFRQELCNQAGIASEAECRDPSKPLPPVGPGGVLTLLALGKVYMEMRAPLEAMKYFQRGMQLDPRSAELKHEAGYANYELKNYAGAIALYQAALSLERANPLLYKRLGLAYQALGDGANAAKAFRKYLEMEPDAPDRSMFERYR